MSYSWGMKVLVGIPAYRCAPQIGRVIDGFDQKLLERLEKVIVIDNQSPDDTIEAAKKAIAKTGSDKFEVWRNDNNYSLGGTHKVAFLAAEKLGCDYVAILHGDDQARTEELGHLLDRAEERPEIDGWLGCRFCRKSRLVGYDWKRIWGNRVLNWVYTILTGRRTKDLGSGLNLYKLSALKDHHYLGFADSMTFNFELLLDLYSKHLKLRFVPITWTEEDQVTNARNFKVAWTALKNLWAWRTGRLQRSNHSPADYPSTKVAP
jgi:dolichol-phosphate mannosyltransferase